MNKKIFHNIYNYAEQNDWKNLSFSENEKHILIDGYTQNGESQRLLLPKKLEHDFFNSLQKILNIDAGELISEKEGQITTNQGPFKYKLNTLPGQKNDKIIINIIKKVPELWRFNQLGLSKLDIQNIKHALQKKSGLIIISSPSAQGKSSTLRSLLLNSDSNKFNIYSLENHAPYKIAGITILPNNVNILEKLLHHDSDQIFIDNLDKSEILKEAIRAASSGRLVIGTLTADNSFEVIKKILRVDLPLRLKLDSLQLIINQRLIKLKRKPKISSADQRKIIGLFEIFKISSTLKNIIIKNQKITSDKLIIKIKKTSAEDGFKSWEDDKKQKIKEGLL